MVDDPLWDGSTSPPVHQKSSHTLGVSEICSNRNKTRPTCSMDSTGEYVDLHLPHKNMTQFCTENLLAPWSKHRCKKPQAFIGAIAIGDLVKSTLGPKGGTETMKDPVEGPF